MITGTLVLVKKTRRDLPRQRTRNQRHTLLLHKKVPCHRRYSDLDGLPCHCSHGLYLILQFG